MRQANTSRKGWLSGHAFTPHRLDLVVSLAWRIRPRALAKIVERLEIEDLRHAGKENGSLSVSYGQFVSCGVSRRYIRPALDLGVAVGLIEVIQSDTWLGDLKPDNRYRLTYLPAKGKNAPTDEWSYVADEQVKAAVAGYKAATRTQATEDAESMAEVA